MTSVLNYEQDKLELEGLPEYVRESEASSRDAFVSISTKSLAEREAQRTLAGAGVSAGVYASTNYSSTNNDHPYPRDSQRDTGGFNRVTAEVEAPKPDELEALWPGVHQDFLHSPKRTPSFYMMLGFMGGAFVSMFAVWCFAGVSQFAHGSDKVQTANNGGQSQAAQQAAPPVATMPQGSDPGAVLIPAHTTVSIGSGDTLAAIALREYKRVSPRLLDEICRNNGLKNANFLNLGQKINLPNYQAQSTQVAVTPQGQVH
jgi:nucleoid-associated protein YgaU